MNTTMACKSKPARLPVELRNNLQQLGAAIGAGRGFEPHLSNVLVGIRSLPAASIAKLDYEIRDLAELYCLDQGQSWTPQILQRALSREAQLGMLRATPKLAHIFQFHSDGYLREAALIALVEPPASAFEFAAVTNRLNDWVQQVRRAAADYARRSFPLTAPDVVAEAATFLLARVDRQRRWSGDEQVVLTAALERRDVAEAIVRYLKTATAGHITSFFKQSLRSPGIDSALPALASEALLPSVRATALDALVMRRARWITGFEYEWIDKRYGRGRRVPVLAERTITHDLDVEALVVRAAQDKAATVRKIATTWLVDQLGQLTPKMIALAERLTKDSSTSVRERARFVLEKSAAT